MMGDQKQALPSFMCNKDQFNKNDSFLSFQSVQNRTVHLQFLPSIDTAKFQILFAELKHACRNTTAKHKEQ
jgi:hypothetical protein